MRKWKIFLDDEREIPAGFIGVDTPEMCILFLQLIKMKGDVVEILSLDHDLGLIDPETLEEKTGYDVILFLEQNTKYMPDRVEIHSANPVGRRRMQLALDSIWRRM